MTTSHPKQVLLIGLGLIGGSIGKALCRSAPGTIVMGYDADSDVRERAISAGAVHRCATHWQDELPGSQVVVVATPIRATEGVLEQLSLHDASPDLIIDVAGVKESICARAVELGLGKCFVGGHPMAGSERSGLAASSAELFHNHPFALVANSQLTDTARGCAEWLIGRLGASGLWTTAEEHDRWVGFTSHLPHLLAITLTASVAGAAGSESRIWDLVAGSFDSATRVIQRPAALTVDMLVGNRKHLIEAARCLQSRIHEVVEMIGAGDLERLEATIRELQRVRPEAD